MYQRNKSKSASRANWLESIEKIQDNTAKKYFSMLPEEKELQRYFSDAFLINQPKGRVGGDGFWLHTHGPNVYIALFTCIGEGHLANMMVRIYLSALKKMVDGYLIEFPGSILQFLHNEVLARFRNRNNILLNTNANVGIVKMNLQSKEMEFAGANMNLIQVSRAGVAEIKGEEHQVGQSTEKIINYTSNTVKHVKDSNFYLCSSGLFNLIGGQDYKKVDVDELGKLWRGLLTEDMATQKSTSEKFLQDWTGMKGQNDDIMVLGFKA